MKLAVIGILFVLVFIGGWGLGRVTSNRDVTVVWEGAVEKKQPAVARFSGEAGKRLDDFRELDGEGRVALLERWLGERPELIDLALAHWAQEDPLAALEAVNSLPKQMRRLSRGAVVGEWMRSEPAGAIAFLEGLETDELKGRKWWEAFRSAGEELAQLDPVAALRLSMRPIDASAGKPWGTLDVVYDQWAKNDRESLLAWANGIDWLAPRSMAIGALGGGLGKLGREGLEWLDAQEFSQYDRELAEGRLAISWVAADPEGVERALLAGDLGERSRLESELISDLLINRADEMVFPQKTGR